MDVSLEGIKLLLSSKDQEVDAIKTDIAQAEVFIASAKLKLASLLGSSPETSLKGRTLKTFIKSVLANSNEPLTIKEIEELVLEAGYTTNSKYLRSIILNNLVRDSEFKRVTKPRTKPSRYILEEV